MTETRNEHFTEPGFEAGNGHRSGAFLKGLVGGALIGAAAGLVCAPQVYAALRTFRRQLMNVSDSGAQRYRHVTTEVGGAFDDLQKARDVAEKAPSSVARAAGDVTDRRIEREAETAAAILVRKT
jgi:gas vesicle protein